VAFKYEIYLKIIYKLYYYYYYSSTLSNNNLEICFIFLSDGQSQSKNDSLLSGDLDMHIQQSLSVFSAVTEQLMKGTISLGKLDQIIRKSESLLKVQQTIELNETSNSGSDSRQKVSQILKQVIIWRKKELEKYHHQKQAMAGFVQMCQNMNAGLILFIVVFKHYI